MVQLAACTTAMVALLSCATGVAQTAKYASDVESLEKTEAMDRSLQLREQAFANLPRPRGANWMSDRSLANAVETDNFARDVYVRALAKLHEQLVPAYASHDAHRMRDAMRSFTVAELAAIDDFILTTTEGQRLVKSRDFTYGDVLIRSWQAVRNGSKAEYRPVFIQRAMQQIVIQLPGGRSFMAATFFPPAGVQKIFDECRGRKDDYSLLMPVRGDGTPFAVIHQARGKLHGFSCAEFEDGGLMMYGGYTENERDVRLLVLAEDRSIRFAGEYAKGDKEGLVCVFRSGKPLLVQVCRRDRATESHLIGDDGRVAASYDDVSGTDAPDLIAALSLLKNVEDELREGEKKVKQYVEKVELAVRNWRAAQNGMRSQARFGQLQAVRSAENMLLYGSLRAWTGAH